MKKYEVVALSVGGRGNKIYKSKDIVTEKNFPEGNAERLVKKGFLKPLPADSEIPAIPAPSAIEGDPVTELVEKDDAADDDSERSNEDETGDAADHEEPGDTDTEESDTEKTDAPAADAKEKFFVNKKGETVIVRTPEDITKAEIMDEFKKENFEFDSMLNKATLFDIWFNK